MSVPRRSQLTRAQSTTVEYVYNKSGGVFCKSLIKLLVKLSAPARTALRQALMQLKISLQVQLNAAILRAFRNSVLEAQRQTLLNAVSAKLSESRNTVNLLSSAIDIAEDLDDPCIQKFVKTFTGLNVPKLPAVNFGGFDAINANVQSLNYQLTRIQRATNLSQDALDILNSKINMIDQYINILDAI